MHEETFASGNPEMQVAVVSEKGNRDENQDWMSWSRIRWGECYIVADGMGGYKGGAVASKMTVQGLERYLKESPSDWPFEKALREALDRTNREVYTSAHNGDPDTENMGSTVALALISDSKVQVGHLGDSRVYLLRRGQLRLLTKDHTAVQRMVDAGMITPEQAREHPDAHILSRAVGSKPEAEIEISEPIDLEQGDGILLCSDGVHAYVNDAQLEKVVNCNPHVQDVPNALVDLALRSGSDDNLTVQFIRYGTSTGTTGRLTRLTAKFLGTPGSEDRFALRKTGLTLVRSKRIWAAVLAIFGILAAVLWIRGLRRPDTSQGSKPDYGQSTYSSAYRARNSTSTRPAVSQTRTSGQSAALAQNVRTTPHTTAAGTKPNHSKKASTEQQAHVSEGEHSPEPEPAADPIKRQRTNTDRNATVLSAAPTESVGPTNAAEATKIPVLVLVHTESEMELARKVIDFIQQALPDVSPEIWDQAGEEQPDLPSNAFVIYTEESSKSVAGRLSSALQNMPDAAGMKEAQILQRDAGKLADSAKAKAGQAQYLVVVLPK